MGRVLFFHQKILNPVIAIGLGLFLPLVAARTVFSESSESGVVAVDRLNLRQGPGLGRPVVKVLERRDQVLLLGRKNGWLHIAHGKDRGYVADQPHFIRWGAAAPPDARLLKQMDAAAAKSDDIQRQLAAQSLELADFTQQEKAVLDRLDKTDRALSNARQKSGAIKADQKALALKMAALTKSAAAVQQSIDANSTYAVNRLVALHKLHRLGETNLLSSAASLQDLMRRKAALERIVAHDAQAIRDLTAEKKRLNGIREQLARQQKTQEKLARELVETLAALNREKAEREKVLAEIKKEKRNRLASVKYLKAAARELESTLRALEEEQIRERQKAEQAAREAAEKKAKEAARKAAEAKVEKAKIKAEQAARREAEARKAAAAKAEQQAMEARKKRKEVAARRASEIAAARKQPPPVQKKPAVAPPAPPKRAVPAPEQKSLPQKDFSALRGLLQLPVSGNIVSKFGKYIEPHSGAVNYRNGIEIQAGRGTPIRAVFSGQTIFSSWIKGYGNVVIIDHGKHYHTVYAHVEEVFCAKGKPVKAGEVIATVGDSGAFGGPTLYFEIRHRGSPVDPLKWVN